MTKTDKAEKKEFVPNAFLTVEENRLYKVVDTSKGNTPVDGHYFDKKEQAKIHRNTLNEEAGKESKYQLRKGPDHWKG